MENLKKSESILLQLAIFLIPTNLAYHWYIDEAYLNGRLVDYLLPKIYLSDIPIFILILIGIFRFIKNKNTFKLPSISFFLFLAYLLVNAFFSGSPISSVWYILKIIELVLFGIYLIHFYTKKSILQLISLPLLASIIFQSLLGLYQYINHNSLIGYSFLGEPNLKSAGIAQTNLFGILEVSPYGTTAHPNVLGGFLFITLVLWLLSTHLSPNTIVKKVLTISLISLSTSIIVLSGSLSALSGIFFVTLLFILHKYVSTRLYNVITLMYICGSLIGSVLFMSSSYQSSNQADNQSINARYELNQVAFSLIKRAPLTGIGPNSFTTYVPKQTIAGQRTLFLQPVHHIGLLIWSETGLIGLILIIWSLNRYRTIYQMNVKTNRRTQYIYFLPLVGLVLIGSVDHYPLTLQTGQLLTTLSLILPLLK